jgi:hypothetical protein
MQTTIVGEGESQWMIVIIIIEYSGTEKWLEQDLNQMTSGLSCRHSTHWASLNF